MGTKPINSTLDTSIKYSRVLSLSGLEKELSKGLKIAGVPRNTVLTSGSFWQAELNKPSVCWNVITEHEHSVKPTHNTVMFFLEQRNSISKLFGKKYKDSLFKDLHLNIVFTKWDKYNKGIGIANYISNHNMIIMGYTSSIYHFYKALFKWCMENIGFTQKFFFREDHQGGKVLNTAALALSIDYTDRTYFPERNNVMSALRFVFDNDNDIGSGTNTKYKF